MYEPFVTVEPHRQSDGMVHFAVEFRDSDGVMPMVPWRSFTATFTEDWFRTTCKKRLESLNKPQEISTVKAGPVDVSTVPAEVVPDAETTAFQRNIRKMAKYRWIKETFDPDVVNHTDYIATVEALKKAEYKAKHLEAIPSSWSTQR